LRGAAEHRARLDPDVGRAVAGPLLEGLRDLVERLRGGEVGTGGGDAGDADGHLRVVAPLARLVRAEAAAEHVCLAGGRRGELVGDAERVAAGLAGECAGGRSFIAAFMGCSFRER
jgi:hypothetical protein